jgi:hypothetical protein
MNESEQAAVAFLLIVGLSRAEPETVTAGLDFRPVVVDSYTTTYSAV